MGKERVLTPPTEALRQQIATFLESPRKGKLFSWSQDDRYGQSIEMDVLVKEATKQIDSVSVSTRLAASEIRPPKKNGIYVGDKLWLSKWLTAAARALENGIDPNTIANCALVAQIRLDKINNLSTLPYTQALYEYFLKDLSSRQFDTQ